MEFWEIVGRTASAVSRIEKTFASKNFSLAFLRTGTGEGIWGNSSLKAMMRMIRDMNKVLSCMTSAQTFRLIYYCTY